MSLMNRIASIDRGVEVISNWIGEGATTVTPTLAQKRADICLQCPQNKDGSKMIEAIAVAIKKHLNVKNQIGLRVKGEKSLKECGVCLCCLRLKVWVPIDYIRRQMMDGEEEMFRTANQECWQYTE